ncbi:MAG: hypothetical protein KDB07_13485, partial [Planctomycetes bacterium]|nr:hypothetical protein [Planctomycetota bacterium]
IQIPNIHLSEEANVGRYEVGKTYVSKPLSTLVRNSEYASVERRDLYVLFSIERVLPKKAD